MVKRILHKTWYSPTLSSENLPPASVNAEHLIIPLHVFMYHATTLFYSWSTYSWLIFTLEGETKAGNFCTDLVITKSCKFYCGQVQQESKPQHKKRSAPRNKGHRADGTYPKRGFTVNQDHENHSDNQLREQFLLATQAVRAWCFKCMQVTV